MKIIRSVNFFLIIHCEISRLGAHDRSHFSFLANIHASVRAREKLANDNPTSEYFPHPIARAQQQIVI
jgi:hypothetical protein